MNTVNLRDPFRPQPDPTTGLPPVNTLYGLPDWLMIRDMASTNTSWDTPSDLSCAKPGQRHRSDEL